MEKKSTKHWENLKSIREKVLEDIKALFNELGGKVYVAYYHYEKNMPRYTFFDVDRDGHGFEMYIEAIEKENDRIVINFLDSEDTYSNYKYLTDVTVVEAMYILEELENIKEYVEKNCEEVVTEFDYDC